MKAHTDWLAEEAGPRTSKLGGGKKDKSILKQASVYREMNEAI